MVLNISKSNQRLNIDKISIGVKINKNHVNCELYNFGVEDYPGIFITLKK